MALVVDATGQPEVGEMLAAACAAARLPLNVVDNKPLCSFLFPAICQCGPLTAGVSTGGASPLAAAWARDQLIQALPDRFDQLLEQMDQLRGQAKRRIPDQRDRGAFLKRCFTRAIEQGGPLSEQEVDELWEGRS